MAKKLTTKKPLVGNRRSHALNATKHAQKPNLQKVTVNGETVKTIYDYLKSEEKDVATGEITAIDLPKSNVLHFCLGGNAVIVRPSGTEPKIKLYITSIGKTEEESVEIGNKIADDVKVQLGLN